MEHNIEKEREIIMGIFNKMTHDELLEFISKNLYFDEDFCVDEWKIYANELIYMKDLKEI